MSEITWKVPSVQMLWRWLREVRSELGPAGSFYFPVNVRMKILDRTRWEVLIAHGNPAPGWVELTRTTNLRLTAVGFIRQLKLFKQGWLEQSQLEANGEN